MAMAAAGSSKCLLLIANVCEGFPQGEVGGDLEGVQREEERAMELDKGDQRQAIKQSII